MKHVLVHNIDIGFYSKIFFYFYSQKYKQKDKLTYDHFI